MSTANCGVSAGQGNKDGKPERLMLHPLYLSQHLTCSGRSGILMTGHKMQNAECSSLGALITSFVK